MTLLGFYLVLIFVSFFLDFLPYFSYTKIPAKPALRDVNLNGKLSLRPTPDQF